MNTLLRKIKQRLQSRITRVGSNDIFLSISETLIPNSVKPHCIGIRAGKTTNTDLMADVVERGLPVEIYVYKDYLFRDEDIEALLDTTASIESAMKGFDISGYTREVSTGNPSEIQWMTDKASEILYIKQTLVYEYFKEE